VNLGRSRYILALIAIVAAVFIWSAIHPKDRLTWLLEVAPALLAVPILFATHRRFTFTPLAYTLIAIHCIILMIGGHYTYAEVPAFNWLRDHFHLNRNHYDRLGHFAQGFVPAILAREVLLRRSPLQRGKWLTFIVFAICMMISALYELFEWLTAVIGKQSAEAFLGTQGDPWDTQKDMACCLIGAVTALLLLPRLHDKQLLVSPLNPTPETPHRAGSTNHQSPAA
jgi:putative membrane protein